jgi:hypothetical protein
MTLAVLLLIISLILFIVSSANVASRINLQSAGLAFLAAAMLVPMV